jgi:type I restriction enzyme S subunit
MIEDLKPYPQYKDSGLPWLGQVPAHWVERRAKYFFREVDERSESGNEELMSVSHKTGVTTRKQSVTMFLAESTVGYKICRPGDIAINTMWAFMGALGIARQEGIVSPAYGVYRPIRPGIIGREYLDKLLRTEAYKTEYIRRSTGINSSRLRLYPDQFLQISFLCPPPDEQSAIARFLAWATNRLDRAIGAKRHIITLLQEQKQAIIHRAVTRGLDPSLPLKDSGIPWLGEIPVHWEVLALKRVLSRLVDCEHKTAPFVQQSDYRVVRTSAVRNGLLRWSGTYCTSAKAFTEWTQRAVPEAGDVIFTREAPAGEACIIPKGAKVCLGQRTVLMKPQRGIYDSQFLVHMIYAGPPRQLIELTCQGSTVSHFNMDDIGWMKILAPPLSEQIEIVAKVTELTEAPSLAIDKTEREITFLREYRTRLISDVVTGKLDVREVAAGLPEPHNANDEQLEPEEEEPEFVAEDTQNVSMD